MTSTATSSTPTDAPPGNWVDRYAPDRAKPFLRLARADRPIGAWLLFWPCAWGAALAALASGAAGPNIWHIALFAIGAFVMRGAGCTFNDIVDRDFDARVARTATRPIPSGQVSARAATLFMIALSLTGLTILLQFNRTTVWFGVGSLVIVAVYPFMKRITHWPQAVLGLAFNWGALLGWTAIFASLSTAPLLLYAGAIAWTVGYDTIYAHQDTEDDAIVGVKSTALLFGDRTVPLVALFYTVAWIGIFAAGWVAGGRVIFATAMAGAAGHMAWQVATLDTAQEHNCLMRFRSNRNLGLIVFAGLAGEAVLRTAFAG